MKTPDEIKKALECCFYDSAQCGECPYYPVSCDRELVRDAREYIRQLEAELQDTRKAVDTTNGFCDICKHQNAHENECEANDFLCYNCPAECACKECYPNESHYEWRGVQKEE